MPVPCDNFRRVALSFVRAVVSCNCVSHCSALKVSGRMPKSQKSFATRYLAVAESTIVALQVPFSTYIPVDREKSRVLIVGANLMLYEVYSVSRGEKQLTS